MNEMFEGIDNWLEKPGGNGIDEAAMNYKQVCKHSFPHARGNMSRHSG